MIYLLPNWPPYGWIILAKWQPCHSKFFKLCPKQISKTTAVRFFLNQSLFWYGTLCLIFILFKNTANVYCQSENYHLILIFFSFSGKLLASCDSLVKLSLGSECNSCICYKLFENREEEKDLATLIVQNAQTLKVMAVRVVEFSCGGVQN